MASHTFKFTSPQAMDAWGRAFARKLHVGDTVALIGPLGAGKTTLVQSIAKAWGYPSGASSPTFALANEYKTRRGMIYHMDMYRLSKKELAAFPLDDYGGSGLCLIEWADRIVRRLPSFYLAVQIDITGPESRSLRVMRKGKRRAA
jgi:tRNA threonylcarbamoyladenosine biosynthesis protein TsaE